MQNEYQKKSNKVLELAALPPEQLVNTLSKHNSDLSQVAPNLAPAIHAVAVKGINFLHSKLPKPNQEFLGDDQWKPSKSQQAQWLHYHEAVNNPISILSHIKEGTLSNNHLEALNTVHPELMNEMKQKVMEQMNPKAMKKLNYSSKISLSKFLGQPLTGSLIPQVIQADQAVYASQGAPTAPAGAPKRKGSTLGGLAKLDLGKRAATETHELEESPK